MRAHRARRDEQRLLDARDGAGLQQQRKHVGLARRQGEAPAISAHDPPGRPGRRRPLRAPCPSADSPMPILMRLGLREQEQMRDEQQRDGHQCTSVRSNMLTPVAQRMGEQLARGPRRRTAATNPRPIVRAGLTEAGSPRRCTPRTAPHEAVVAAEDKRARIRVVVGHERRGQVILPQHQHGDAVREEHAVAPVGTRLSGR